jgi:murein DD-endopeptidase MepM/ murein hydrolase activator NlpD
MAISPIFQKEIPISQKFANYFNGYYAKWWMKGHDGTDFATPVGTPIMAGFDGIVTVPPFMAWGYGNYLTVRKKRTDGDSELLFGHLSKILVKNGQVVKKDTIIGETGNSGWSTGPHLHFSLRFYKPDGTVLNPDNGFKGRVDPIQYFENQKYFL